MTSIRDHVTYANLAATLAVVIALGGTAHAVGLPKNSVGSKQVKNNSLSTKDLKNGSATGADVKGDSLTGAQVDESTLGAVPRRSPRSTRRTWAGGRRRSSGAQGPSSRGAR